MSFSHVVMSCIMAFCAKIIKGVSTLNLVSWKQLIIEVYSFSIPGVTEAVKPGFDSINTDFTVFLFRINNTYYSVVSVELWAESDWPDLRWIFGNQHVCLTAGDGVDWQFHWWHYKALADWQPQPLAQTVEWSVLAQDIKCHSNLSHIITFCYFTQTICKCAPTPMQEWTQ